MPREAQLGSLSRAEQRAAAKASAERNDGRPMLSVDGAAVYLNVARDSVYRFIRSGELRSFKVGRTLRIRPSDLDAFLEKRIAS